MIPPLRVPPPRPYSDCSKVLVAGHICSTRAITDPSASPSVYSYLARLRPVPAALQTGKQLAWFIPGIGRVVPVQSAILSPFLLGRLHLWNLHAWLLHGQLVFKDTAQLIVFYDLGLKILPVLLVPNVRGNVGVVGVAGVLQPPGAYVGQHDSHCEEAKEADHQQHVDDFQVAAGTSDLGRCRAICLLQVVLKQLGEE